MVFDTELAVFGSLNRIGPKQLNAAPWGSLLLDFLDLSVDGT